MTPHLRGQVRAYVDRALPASLLRAFDQHLVVCQVCRAAAEQERRIVAALRADTGVPTSLRSVLIGLAAAAEHDMPDVPRAPSGLSASLLQGLQPPTHEPVPTIAPNAPPLHRSPVRAAVVASLAATASVAAAWGLTIVPLPTSERAPAPAARVPIDAGTPGSSSVSQVVSAGTGTGALTAPNGLGITPFSLTPAPPGAIERAPAPDWAATTALGLRHVFTRVQVNLVGSAESRP